MKDATGVIVPLDKLVKRVEHMLDNESGQLNNFLQISNCGKPGYVFIQWIFSPDEIDYSGGVELDQ